YVFRRPRLPGACPKNGCVGVHHGNRLAEMRCRRPGGEDPLGTQYNKDANMGFFDYVRCEAPLPDGRLPTASGFQTKCFSRCMVQFTITAQGRLIFNRHRYEAGPDREIRPGITLPQYKLIQVEDIDMDYHGDVLFGGSTQD